MRRLSSIITLFGILLLTGCQDILECVINRRPQLEDKNLARARLDRFYSDDILAEIKNEPRDNSYYYYFSIDGELPRGLDYIVDYRSIIIEGVPTTPGRYPINIRLTVEQVNDYYEDCENRLNDCDGLCEETTVKRYVLAVD